MNTLKHLLFVGIVFFLISGCRKKEEEKQTNTSPTTPSTINVGSLEGSYQWEYSLKYDGDSGPNLPDHYGVVITSSGHFYYYKNDVLQFSDLITNIHTNSLGDTTFHLTEKLDIDGQLNESTLILTANNQSSVPYCSYYTIYYYNTSPLITTYQYHNYFLKL